MPKNCQLSKFDKPELNLNTKLNLTSSTSTSEIENLEIKNVEKILK